MHSGTIFEITFEVLLYIKAINYSVSILSNLDCVPIFFFSKKNSFLLYNGTMYL